MSQVGVLIPNYGGRELLSRHLPGILRTCEGLQVTVIDDASADDSVEMLGREFPQVRVIARKTNGGFAATVNEGIRATNGEFVVILNNDVEVTPGFLDPILPLFDEDRLFAVSPRILLPAYGNLDEGAKTGFWRHGMFYTDQRQGVDAVTPVLYACGCAAVYRRSMLEELGGFDEAYSPFYWEDADLGYRAWKRGWKSLYQPNGLVYHQHAASISRVSRRFTNRVKSRNALFFIWRNIEDERLLRAHRRWLLFVLARRALSGDLDFLMGWKDARVRGAEATAARERDSRCRKLADREIFAAVGADD